MSNEYVSLSKRVNYSLPPAKLFQIAYNIGQAKVILLYIYIKDTKISFVKKVNTDAAGGYFKHKYIKYKTKYLSAK